MCCLSFVIFTHTKLPIHSVMNRVQSPAPQKPVEAIPWWASGGQLSSYCGCLCQLNTVTFDLSFFPLCLSISASCRALWTLEKKRSSFPSGLTPIVPKKKKKDGRFSIQRWILSLLQLKKKKSTLYVGLCFSFGWECNKDSTRFPIENSKRLEAKVSGAKLLEKSWKFGLAQIKSPHQWHRWEILVAIYYFKPFIEYKGVQECVYS